MYFKTATVLTKGYNKTNVGETPLSLFQGDHAGHGGALHAFVDRCDINILQIIITKNKELVIDFRECRVEHKASRLHGAEVHTVLRYGFGGKVLDLNFSPGINKVK